MFVGSGARVPSYDIGQTQNCLYTARNRGTAAQPSMTLRRSVVEPRNLS
jgi:hypothetical protein